LQTFNVISPVRACAGAAKATTAKPAAPRSMQDPIFVLKTNMNNPQSWLAGTSLLAT